MQPSPILLRDHRGGGMPTGYPARVSRRNIAQFAGRSNHLATPNYSYEKRQRELAKKRKAEEKRQRKINRPDDATTGQAPPAPDAPTVGSTPPPAGSEPTR
jgi:hypothetical protein